MIPNVQPLVFSEENIVKLFGREAAEDEEFERLQSYYIKSKTHDKVTANLPLRILVGHKGIGKSAIFTIARHEDDANHIVSVLIRPDDVDNIGVDSENLSQMIRDWKTGLLAIISEKVCQSIHYIVPENHIVSDYAPYVTQFIPFIKKFFTSRLENKGIDGTDKLLVENFLRQCRVVVYIDDLDRGWQSKPSDILRISALLNAVRDLSNDNKGLQFRISLRTDVYYLVRTADESTDKIEGSVIWHKWSNHEILLLLIKRIESFFGREFNIEINRNVEQIYLSRYLDSVFEKKFTDSGKWSNAPMSVVLMSLIRKRPRDLVKLCTSAAKVAYDSNKNKIDTDCMKAIFEEYSQGRIQDTVIEYRSELPTIERLLLNMKPSGTKRRYTKGYVYTTQELHKKISSVMEQGDFIFKNGKKATIQDLHHFLYKINFLTARKELENGYIDRKYFEENKYLTTGLADFGYDWEIHPAFRWALSPENSTNIFKVIGLSNPF